LLSDGFRLALTTLTVAPVGGPRRVDRAVAAWCMRWAPLVGALLGALLAAIRWGLPPSLKGLLTVAAAALLTRGLHLDGLADTVDGLGSYKGRERALEIMRSPGVGPFGVVALVLVLAVQATTLATVTVAGLIVAVASGRLAAALGCAKGVPAARADGLGALVAGTQDRASLAINTALCAGAAIWAVPHRPWQGPLAVVAAVLVTLGLRQHATRRLGGVTGDVLGFLVEIGTTTVLIGLSVL
jgi:adenosylcobinamide-GDP ribazoletransferase